MRFMSNYQEQLPSFAEGIGDAALTGQRSGYPSSTLCDGTGDAADGSQSSELLLYVIGRALAMALFLWPIGLSAQSSRSTNSVAVGPSSRPSENVQSPHEAMFLTAAPDLSRLVTLEVSAPLVFLSP